MKFGLLIDPSAAIDVLAQRWRLAEDMGFDSIWAPDHTADYRDLAGTWFDGWTLVAAMAERTSRVRVGTLVSNPIIRHPVLLAKEAATIDHLSGGRLDIGIGTGIAGFDHEAMGVDYSSPRERVARFAEYIQIVDELLRTAEPYGFSGRYYTTSGARIAPPTVQRPRPPIIVGGQSPTVLRVAAERADRWNTHGPFGASIDEIARITSEQCRRVDELCASYGRDPASLVRSLLLVDALDAWGSDDSVRKIVELFAPMGFAEFVMFWPPEAKRAELERIATVVIPRLRKGA